MKKNKTVLMFPGQGSQYKGMGLDYNTVSDKFNDYFNLASDLLNESLYDIIAGINDNSTKLDNTLYSQISIYTLSSVIFDYLFEQKILKKEDIFTISGHSLGDYSALYASGYYSFKDGLKLVKYRGSIMSEANEKMDGMMAAVIGVDYKSLENLLIQYKDKFKEEVYIANYNEYSQLVISGKRSGIEKAIDFLKENKIRKIIPLKVKIASHTPLMKDISLKVGDYLKNIILNEPVFNFFSSTSLIYPKIQEIKSVLENQLISQVNWVNSIEYFLNNEVNIFIEVGPGKVLSGLTKRIAEKNQKEVLIFNSDNPSELSNLKNYLS
ncbi:MAG: ACP S-malonyltransferase [Actinobacteria bacterium]|nr:ACP S-malonyltransferase [Cyanobacteriota bacterium]MCL5771988.1 ACP S-malonyltransferase [Actinomycetota bacterium]